MLIVHDLKRLDALAPHPRGTELEERFGAHSIGIGRKRVADKRTDTLALIFYVEGKGNVSEPIPTSIAFTSAGKRQPVDLPTNVVETPPVGPGSAGAREQ